MGSLGSSEPTGVEIADHIGPPHPGFMGTLLTLQGKPCPVPDPLHCQCLDREKKIHICFGKVLESPRQGIRTPSPRISELHPCQLTRPVRRKCFRIPLCFVPLPAATPAPPITAGRVINPPLFIIPGAKFAASAYYSGPTSSSVTSPCGKATPFTRHPNRAWHIQRKGLLSVCPSASHGQLPLSGVNHLASTPAVGRPCPPI